jgi:hypothetical protein
VWSSVVCDLLLVSPNTRIQQTLSNMTTEELRTIALRYYTSNIRYALFVSLGSSRCLTTRTYAATARVRQIRFLPTGAPFAICISGTAAIQLWNLGTGRDAFVWQPSQASQRVHNFTAARIDFWDCDDWSSCVFLVSIAVSELPYVDSFHYLTIPADN